MTGIQEGKHYKLQGGTRKDVNRRKQRERRGTLTTEIQSQAELGTNMGKPKWVNHGWTRSVNPIQNTNKIAKSIVK
jgi:hypothetical protein